MSIFILFVFFFSSRRRHTRCGRDWSSDVCSSDLEHIGVSRRIEDRAERQRIKAIITDLKPKGVGVIARTVGEGKEDPEFAADVKHLVKLWHKIDRKAAGSRAPSLVHRELE